MPIQIPPALLAAAQARKARLHAEAQQFSDAAQKKQDQIDGVAGPAPGLQAEDDVQADLYAQYDARIALFENERRALDGVYPNPPVTSSIIEASAAGVRPTLIFPLPPPPGISSLDPVFVDGLKGLGGNDSNNELARKAAELTHIATLLSMTPASRPGSAAHLAWTASLTAQSALLATQISNATANESYGASHPDVVAAAAEKAAVDALLPTPPTDNATLTARQTQATARQAAIPVRVATIVNDVTPFYNNRYLVLKGRVRVGQGTLTNLKAAENTINVLNEFAALNYDTIALYTSLGA